MNIKYFIFVNLVLLFIGCQANKKSIDQTKQVTLIDSLSPSGNVNTDICFQGFPHSLLLTLKKANETITDRLYSKEIDQDYVSNKTGIRLEDCGFQYGNLFLFALRKDPDVSWSYRDIRIEVDGEIMEILLKVGQEDIFISDLPFRPGKYRMDVIPPDSPFVTKNFTDEYELLNQWKSSKLLFKDSLYVKKMLNKDFIVLPYKDGMLIQNEDPYLDRF